MVPGYGEHFTNLPEERPDWISAAETLIPCSDNFDASPFNKGSWHSGSSWDYAPPIEYLIDALKI
jgi:hypothetical protein